VLSCNSQKPSVSTPSTDVAQAQIIGGHPGFGGQFAGGEQQPKDSGINAKWRRIACHGYFGAGG
jgi:hypothetical protein